MKRLGFVIAAAMLWSVPASAEHVRIGTPEATAFAFDVIDVGIGSGIFAAHDLDVEKINFAGGGKMQQGMAAGAIDLSVAGNAELAYVAKGAPEIGVAVTAGAPVDMAVIVRNDNDITKIDDLKGKTVGVTSATSLTSYLALRLSQRQGWGNDGIKRAYIGGTAASVPALLVKNIDAFVGPTEGALLLQSQGKARELMNFGDLGAFITHVICASDTLVQNHPDEVRRFLAGWFATVAWMETHKDDTVRLVSPPTGLPPDLAAKVYDMEMPAMSRDGKFEPKAVAATMQSFIDMGLLDAVPQNKELYTEKFLP